VFAKKQPERREEPCSREASPPCLPEVGGLLKSNQKEGEEPCSREANPPCLPKVGLLKSNQKEGEEHIYIHRIRIHFDSSCKVAHSIS
jgi:hypothetical protein